MLRNGTDAEFTEEANPLTNRSKSCLCDYQQEMKEWMATLILLDSKGISVKSPN